MKHLWQNGSGGFEVLSGGLGGLLGVLGGCPDTQQSLYQDQALLDTQFFCRLRGVPWGGLGRS